MMEKPASTWSFDQGTLTVRHLGKTVSLGGYATHEFAAKAAAVYFAKHSGHCCLPQSRRAAAKAPQSGPSPLREPSHARMARDYARKPRGLKPTGAFTHAPERKKHWALRSASSAAATLSRKLVSTATANY